MTSLLALLAQTAPSADASAQAAPAGGGFMMLAVYALFFGGFFFLFIRPQQKKAKETAQKQASLKTGDRVATSGGIIGKVVTVEDTQVTLEVASGVRIPFLRNHIVEFFADEAAK